MEHQPGSQTSGLFCRPAEDQPHPKGIAFRPQAAVQCRKQHGLQPDGSTGSQRPQAPLHPAPEHQFFRRREEQADPQQIPRPADLGRSHSAGAQE